jgi:surface carbohydrate biosynthesis protein
MRNLWQLIGLLLRAKWCWSKPRRSDVLIFDAAHQGRLMVYLKPWNPEVLHAGLEVINMRVLLASFLKVGRLSTAYVDCFIEFVHPRLIVTAVDNNPNFYTLEVRHPYLKTLFIQNGIRAYYYDAFEALDRLKLSGDPLKVNFMMTVGCRVGAEYAKYIEGTVIPMGSLRNNLVPKRQSKNPSTIAFTSQYRNTKGFVMGDKFYSFQDFFEQADRLVLRFLLQYAKKHCKRLIIVPCSGHYKDDTLKREKAYYNALLAGACTFSEWHWHGSSYEEADKAEVFVSIDCTLGFESAARGNKTAFFPIRSHLLGVPGITFGWPEPYPDDGPFWTNRPDTAAFERILDHLFAISDEQWQAELAEHQFGNIMAYDPGNTILQSVLQRELGAPPQTGRHP